jgi:hypothetical protein
VHGPQCRPDFCRRCYTHPRHHDRHAVAHQRTFYNFTTGNSIVNADPRPRPSLVARMLHTSGMNGKREVLRSQAGYDTFFGPTECNEETKMKSAILLGF